MATLEDKLLKAKQKEDALEKKLKEVGLQKESHEREVQMLRDKANDSKGELAKLQQAWAVRLR